MGRLPQKMYWRGQDVETLPRETLIEMIKHLGDELERTREQAKRDVRFVTDIARRGLSLPR